MLSSVMRFVTCSLPLKVSTADLSFCIWRQDTPVLLKCFILKQYVVGENVTAAWFMVSGNVFLETIWFEIYLK